MFNKLLSGVVSLSFVATVMMAAEGVRFNVTTNDVEDIYNTMVNEKLEDTGFILSDPHERINDAYLQKYSKPELDGKKNDAYDPDFKITLDNLGFFSVSADEAMRELLIKEPDLGGFTPFNLHIYKEKGKKETYVGHITPETMLDIVGVKDISVRKAFIKSFKPLDDLVQKEIGGKVVGVGVDKIPSDAMMKFEYKFDRPEDVTEFVDEFQEQFEEAFEDHNFIIAGYKNYRETYDDLEQDFEKYDAYWVYSLCHFVFSYNIFNKGRPDAGAFAPCSMYMYIEKDSNILHIGMPTLQNWKTVMQIKDAKKLKSIDAIDKEIIDIMKDLGAKKI
jgi:uncharacterized protein (DUF302 family)